MLSFLKYFLCFVVVINGDGCMSSTDKMTTFNCSGVPECKVDCNDSETCNIDCGDGGCVDTIINCPNNADCNICCSGIGACKHLIVDARNSTKLSIDAHNEEDVLYEADIECPRGATSRNTCTIECNECESSGSCIGLSIHSDYGFWDVNIISPNLECCSFSDKECTIFCSQDNDDNSNCTVSSYNNNKCESTRICNSRPQWWFFFIIGFSSFIMISYLIWGIIYYCKGKNCTCNNRSKNPKTNIKTSIEIDTKNDNKSNRQLSPKSDVELVKSESDIINVANDGNDVDIDGVIMTGNEYKEDMMIKASYYLDKQNTIVSDNSDDDMDGTTQTTIKQAKLTNDIESGHNGEQSNVTESHGNELNV